MDIEEFRKRSTEIKTKLGKDPPQVIRERRYQGKEFTTILQAPDSKSLDRLISGLTKYAKTQDMGRVQVLQRGRDPDGGVRATVTAHNFNPVKWVSEKVGGYVEEHQKRKKEEKEFHEGQLAGTISTEVPSPKMERKMVQAEREAKEAKLKEVRKVQEERIKSRESDEITRVRSQEEARRAEARANALETETYGKPLDEVYYVRRDKTTGRVVNIQKAFKDSSGKITNMKPSGDDWVVEVGQKVIYDPRTGRPLGVQDLRGKEREIQARLSNRQIQFVDTKTEMELLHSKLQLDFMKGVVKQHKREKVMGPVRAIARGVEGTVVGVGRGITGMQVNTRPYRGLQTPSVFPTVTRQQQPQVPRRRRPQGRNPYEDQMKKMRRMMF